MENIYEPHQHTAKTVPELGPVHKNAAGLNLLTGVLYNLLPNLK